MKDQKITIKYILAVALAVIVTWITHEFAHWLTSELLGYDTIMKLNATSFVDGEKPTDLHENIISAMGPIITLTQGIITFQILKSVNFKKYLYPF